jgi:hypothetical protein
MAWKIQNIVTNVLSPLLFNNIVLFKYEDGLSHTFGTDYIRKIDDATNYYPTREYLTTYGGYTIIGGNTYDYVVGTNDMWFSTTMAIGIVINEDPESISVTDRKKIEMDLMSEYLNKFLPAHVLRIF